MSWSGLSNNELVSYNDAAGSPYSQITTLPSSNETMTRSDVIGYLNVDANNSGLLARAMNECVQKTDLSYTITSCGSTPSTAISYTVQPYDSTVFGSMIFSVSSIGDFQPVLTIGTITGYGTIRVVIQFYEITSSGTLVGYVGEIDITNGAGTYNGERFGISNPSNLVKAYISIDAQSPTTGSSGTVNISINCPIYYDCGTNYNLKIPNCSDQIGHWFNIGTSSGTGSVNYSVTDPSSGTATLTVTVYYNGSSIYSSTISFGTSSFNFSYTYDGSNPYVYIVFAMDGWC